MQMTPHLQPRYLGLPGYNHSQHDFNCMQQWPHFPVYYPLYAERFIGCISYKQGSWDVVLVNTDHWWSTRTKSYLKDNSNCETSLYEWRLWYAHKWNILVVVIRNGCNLSGVCHGGLLTPHFSHSNHGNGCFFYLQGLGNQCQVNAELFTAGE